MEFLIIVFYNDVYMTLFKINSRFLLEKIESAHSTRVTTRTYCQLQTFKMNFFQRTHIFWLNLNDSRLLDFCDRLLVDAVVGSVTEEVFVALLDHRHHDHKNLNEITKLQITFQVIISKKDLLVMDLWHFK